MQLYREKFTVGVGGRTPSNVAVGVDVIVGVGVGVPNSGTGVLVMTFWVGSGVGVQVGGKNGVLSSLTTGGGFLKI